ncbi:ABC transporter ATP-binding protein [Bradyrhizobium sp. CW7]|uniref:ABC transporter ATP-binding protein n=1 Tax=Bradyrhizobium sp. CW7 TaxID=2782688 RepID=UPI001FF990A6|nr:ABC transporter ATP-binding protein [Bradyrhizobium sp. CW7]MCK1356246.1 ABC transporter ATP-binding protein [Bradyrhizobium sp. CW7]
MTEILSLVNVRKSFGSIEIVRGISLGVKEGEIHAIIGPNGAGKSTLFHLISGQLTPTSGSILLDGNSIEAKTPHEIYRRGLSRSFQITNVFPGLSVWDNLRLAHLWSHGKRNAIFRDLDAMGCVSEPSQKLLSMIGLASRRDVDARLLTYAEQRALELGLAFAGDTKVVLLDEPTAGMSRAETELVVDLIRVLAKERTLLMVEHDMRVVFGLADRISVLVYGQLIATGTPDEVRKNSTVQEAYLGHPAG